MEMVPEIPLQQCYRVLIPPEGIRQDFRLEWNIYKFYNPFERLANFFFCQLGILLPIFHTSYNRALEITGCESIETTLRTRRLLWAGTLL